MNKQIVSLFLAELLFILVPTWTVIADAPSGTTSPGIIEMNCSGCHEKHVKSMTDSSLHVSTHVKKGVDTCSSCHDAAELKRSHANVARETGLVKARRYPQEFCLRCHGPYADLAKRTANSKALTDAKGQVVNPHDIPKTPKHGRLAECGNCHKEHKKNPDVMAFCSGCHHKREFSCAKCHFPDAKRDSGNQR